jgi:hypothetical protein
MLNMNKDLTINFNDALLLQTPWFQSFTLHSACGHRTDSLDLLIFLCLTRQKIDAEHEQRLDHKF